jgi:transcriptional regulator GlxA family with amidase domain
MALALIGKIVGQDIANDLADQVEYDRHRDPSWDPFASKAGLVSDCSADQS